MATQSLGEYDLIVCGAGSAGCVAAIAAARQGTKVLLFDRQGFLGGVSTGVLDTFYGFFTPGATPLKVAGGIPDEVVDLLDAEGGIFLRPNTYGAGTGVTYNPELLKLVWDRMCVEAGVAVLHHAWLVDVLSDGAGSLSGVVLATKGGLRRASASRFIDATGDAELCHLAGIAYEKAGELEPAQTMTTTFRMAGVDLSAFAAAGGKAMLETRAAEAVEAGTYGLPRKLGSFHEMVFDGMVATVAVRVADHDPLDPWQLSGAEREGRRQAYLYERFMRERVPGYEKARIVGLSTGIGVRESRRVYGEYRLTRDDCLSGRMFEDKVLLCGAPIEDHRSEPGGGEETVWVYLPAYSVPYRSLVAKGRDDVWAIGRCFSATHDAHASCRSMAQTMSMGQAAGLAAAISVRSDVDARSLPVLQLQEALSGLGAVLDVPTEAAVTSRDGWQLNRRGGQ